jgi:predicted DCC family thiol-disulfide oxidoreductase YuxK
MFKTRDPRQLVPTTIQQLVHTDLIMLSQRPKSKKHSMATDWSIEVFFDGDCPLCVREINLLRRLDRHCRIRMTNIAEADFDAAAFGLALEDFMSEIHARLPDGTWVRGVEVFRQLYTIVGWSRVVWLTRLPIIAGGLERGYRVFARNRLRWTGRCKASKGQLCKPARAARDTRM